MNDRRGLQSLLERRAGEAAAESLPRADAVVVLGGTLSPPGASGGDANLSAPAQWTLLAWTASPAALDVTTRALTEYVGWLVYRNRGWIGGGGGS